MLPSSSEFDLLGIDEMVIGKVVVFCFPAGAHYSMYALLYLARLLEVKMN